jgi:hypothetical protein
MHWEKWEIHTKFWSETQKGRDHAEEIGEDVNIVLGWI